VHIAGDLSTFNITLAASYRKSIEQCHSRYEIYNRPCRFAACINTHTYDVELEKSLLVLDTLD